MAQLSTMRYYVARCCTIIYWHFYITIKRMVKTKFHWFVNKNICATNVFLCYQSTYPSSMCHRRHHRHCVVTLWLLPSWFCHSRHIVVVSLSLSCIIAVSSPSLCHCVVFVVFVVVMSWVSSLSCCGCCCCCCCCRCCTVVLLRCCSVVVLLQCCCVVAVLLCCCGVVVLLWCCCVVVVLLCCCGVVVLLWCCGVVVVLLCCCGVVVSVYGPGCCTCHTWPTLGFALAHPVHSGTHLVDGLGPCTCPRHSVVLHHCCVIVIIASSLCCHV